ncbi:hypothetical protein ACWD1Y_02430 [Streptomyces sp. NPDC002814]
MDGQQCLAAQQGGAGDEQLVPEAVCRLLRLDGQGVDSHALPLALASLPAHLSDAEQQLDRLHQTAITLRTAGRHQPGGLDRRPAVLFGLGEGEILDRHGTGQAVVGGGRLRGIRGPGLQEVIGDQHAQLERSGAPVDSWQAWECFGDVRMPLPAGAFRLFAADTPLQDPVLEVVPVGPQTGCPVGDLVPGPTANQAVFALDTVQQVLDLDPWRAGHLGECVREEELAHGGAGDQEFARSRVQLPESVQHGRGKAPRQRHPDTVFGSPQSQALLDEDRMAARRPGQPDGEVRGSRVAPKPGVDQFPDSPGRQRRQRVAGHEFRVIPLPGVQ